MNLISKRFRSAAVVGAAMLATVSAGAQTITLKYNPKAGTKYKTTMTTDIDMGMEMSGMPLNTTINMSYYTTQTVSKGEGKTKSVRVNYDRVVMEGAAMGSSMNYDSDKPGEGSSELADVGKIVDKPFTMTVTEDGKISRVEGLDNVTGGTNALTADGVQHMMQQSLEIYPNRAVKPGDTWVRNSTSDISSMKLNSKNTYKLESVSGGVARISLTSEMNTDEAGEPGEGMQMKMSGIQSGTMSVDIASGLILESTLNQNLSGEMVTGDATVPLTVKGNHKVVGTLK